MDNLEKWFKNHRSAFDPLKVGPESWEKVRNGLQKSRVPFYARVPVWLKVAAVLFVVACAVLFWQQGQDKEEMAIHTVLPDVALEAPDGNTVRLSDLNSKVVLVNFWASWHDACQENNCYIFKPIYEKYKEMGFEIYGISIDSDREAWLVSILEEELPWVHVSDLKSWQSPIALDLEVTRLPTSFLVDQNRRIIAKDLNAEELDKTLADLLAYN